MTLSIILELLIASRMSLGAPTLSLSELLIHAISTILSFFLLGMIYL